MEIELEPSSVRFDPLDERWLRQVALLAADLRREVGAGCRCSEPEPGTKGVALGPIVIDLEPVIVLLGSAGAFPAIAGVIKAFIARDHGRSIRARWYKNGTLEQIDIQGDSSEAAERLIVALQRATGSSE